MMGIVRRNSTGDRTIVYMSSFLYKLPDIIYLCILRKSVGGMKTPDFIKSQIDLLPAGVIFAYQDVMPDPSRREAVIKALNRMSGSGLIAKWAKGKFYKPRETAFGRLEPAQDEVIRDLLERNGQPIGYLTGLSIYNRSGLTTQISNVIQIGTPFLRPTLTRGRFSISFVRQKNTIARDNIPLLQILDAIRSVKKIPDTPIAQVVSRLTAIVRHLPEEDKLLMVRLSFLYPPATRAILGSILDATGNKYMTDQIRGTLNPVTSFKLPGVGAVLKTATDWNIR